MDNIYNIYSVPSTDLSTFTGINSSSPQSSQKVSLLTDEETEAQRGFQGHRAS